ncbi:MAG: carboxyl transferase domain-containing protein [Candidatus Limnocylindrales bacterium]
MYSQDFTVFDGSLSEAHAEKTRKVKDLAPRTGSPIVEPSDSGGARSLRRCRFTRRPRRHLPVQHARLRRRPPGFR